MHHLINLSWKCQLKCPYCLLPHIKINRTAPEHSWAEWAVALRDYSTPGSVLDFAGGDPLLFPGLAQLLDYLGSTGRRWAITTNALSDEGVSELLRVRPGNCAVVNVSDHPGNGRAAENIKRLQGAYQVMFNRVDHPLAGQNLPRAADNLIPFQTWETWTELDGIPRWCNSGQRHFVADPGGDVFRCNPYMATAQAPMGNLFKGTVRRPEPFICETGCSTCYTAVGHAAWQVEARPV